MGATYNGLVVADTTIVTTAETVAATVAGVSTPRPGLKVVITAIVQVTTGGSTTALTPRIRRGTAITDPLVGEANAQQVAAAAGSTETVEIMVEDFPGEVAGQSYVVTVQQTAAAANGAIVQADIRVDVVY